MTGSILTNEGGVYRSFPSARLFCLLRYPDDIKSQRQLFLVLEDELSDWVADPRSHKTSALFDSLDHIVAKSAGKTAVAGLVALVFWRKALAGDRSFTRYAAAQTVSRLLQNERGDDGKAIYCAELERGETTFTGVRAATGRKDIEDRFRARSRFAHFYAAQFLLNEGEPTRTWGDGLRQNPDRWIKAALEIGDVLRNSYARYFPDDLWSPDPIPRSVADATTYPWCGDLKDVFLAEGID